MTIDPALHDQAGERERKRARLNRRVIVTIIIVMLSIACETLLFLYGTVAPLRYVLAVVGGVIGTVVILAGVSASSLLTAGAMRGLLEPGGRGRNLAVFSQAQALASHGDFAGASVVFDALRFTHGDTVELLRAEAEIHLQRGGDAVRARDLLLRLRQHVKASRADELFASHRLVDLYLGTLADPGRAMVELRRMADRFPDTPDGQGALAELRRQRDQLALDQTQL